MLRDERHAAPRQLVGDGKDVAVRQPDVQKRGGEGIVHRFQALFHRGRGDDLGPFVFQDVLEIEKNQELVFHDEQGAPLQAVGQTRSPWPSSRRTRSIRAGPRIPSL